jgi:hydroxyacylglutathione hydrolase
MLLETLTVGPLQCNCYLLGCEETREALVIDPGDDVQVILSRLHARELHLTGIYCTHAHLDHVGALAELKSKTGAPALLHEQDLPLYKNLSLQASWIGLPAPPLTEIDVLLQDEASIHFGQCSGKVLFTPGHSPGSCCFYFAPPIGVFFSGDTLFQGSVGRTDLWGGSYEELMHSIHQKILGLPGNLKVLPGHGPATTVGEERHFNPFLQPT